MPTYPGGGKARRDDPSQSHFAAQQNFTKLERETADIVRLHGKGGNRKLCCVEIHALLGGHAVHPIDSISPRLSRCVEKGLLVRHPKEPRPNRYGTMRKQYVYTYIYPESKNGR